MIKWGHRIRLIVVLFILLLIFGGLEARLYYLQVMNHGFFCTYADKRQKAEITLYPVRGTIFDRHDKILAKSRKTKSIFINPARVNDLKYTKDPDALISTLAKMLDMDRKTVRLKANARYQDKKTEEKKYCTEVMLKRKLSDDEIKSVEKLRANREFFIDIQEGGKKDGPAYKGIYFRDRDERVYPSGKLLCHIIGYMRDEQKPNTRLIRDDISPQGGIELALNDELVGVEGWRRGDVDKKRREVISDDNRECPAVNGYNVFLSIDLNIQSIVEKEIEQAVEDVEFDTCSVIVMDPNTGEILGMAGYPNFNSNHLDKFSDDIVRNHPIATTYEPGSTMKAVTGCIAVDMDVVDLDTEFYCENGRWRVPGHTLKDSHKYETLTFKEIIEKSSNIGIAKVALLIGKEDFHKGLLRFGFRERTGIGLGSEEPGLLASPRKWSRLSIYEIPMGHEISVTSIQLANAFCVIANGGNLMRPILVKKVVDENGHVIREKTSEIVRRVVSKEATDKMKVALEGVVSTDGTARRANIKGYTQAGKTGTAQKVIDGRYSQTIYDSSFVGFAPVKEPRVVILVTMNGTRTPRHYGGTVAAPVFSRIGKQVLEYLGEPKDAPEEELNVVRN